MKKFYILLLCLFVSSQMAFSQKKGDMCIGGTLGISTASVKIEDATSTQTSFGISPSFGYFVADDMLLKASLGYNVENNVGVNSTLFIFGVSAERYIKLCNQLYYTPGVSLGYVNSAIDTLNGSGCMIGLDLFSCDYMVSSKVGISFGLASLKYMNMSYPDYEMKGSAIAFDLAMNPTIGINFFF